MIKINKVEKANGQGKLFLADQLLAQKGDKIGIVGPNGVGKSTLLQMILGQDLEYLGKIQVQGFIENVPQMIVDQKQESGGEMVWRRIREAIGQRPDILILDEPTANLDEAHQNQLVQQLKYYRGILLVVSHDVYFLEQITNQIWAFEQNVITPYHLNYVDYQRQTKQKFEQANQVYSREQRKKKKLLYEAQKQVQAGDRVKRNNNTLKGDTVQAQLTGNAKYLRQKAGQLAQGERPKLAKSLKLQNEMNVRSTQILARLIDLEIFAPTGPSLIDNVSVVIKGADKISLKGPNGVGKTTLLQATMEDAKRHQQTQVGYFSQKVDQLEDQKSILWNVMQNSVESMQVARDFLGAFGLRRDMVERNVATLSGGERVRVSLVATLLAQANFLILDEPTNFLDLPALMALSQFLKDFKGAVLLVSHDQKFTFDLNWPIWEIMDHKLHLIDENI
ncbi:ABC-F family ATP-binding cassette domain-containing protein [Weissella coleopterorum]|uniref:ABC-F family ATP-binding cassette domain-containing protein n=1 Tax=Weissella coleopterorum TaxID=2714949 RepID=A0A6G8B1J8_9LACO|nr:ATP-binding cassette domain-containing protein [Weissella coleopterorum]QIL51102.1 ABC-F family ATP-binding cassette domain-containing protein [Weissella coleopterorum]